MGRHRWEQCYVIPPSSVTLHAVFRRHKVRCEFVLHRLHHPRGLHRNLLTDVPTNNYSLAFTCLCSPGSMLKKFVAKTTMRRLPLVIQASRGLRTVPSAILSQLQEKGIRLESFLVTPIVVVCLPLPATNGIASATHVNFPCLAAGFAKNLPYWYTSLPSPSFTLWVSIQWSTSPSRSTQKTASSATWVLCVHTLAKKRAAPPRTSALSKKKPQRTKFGGAMSTFRSAKNLLRRTAHEVLTTSTPEEKSTSSTATLAGTPNTESR